MDYRKIDTGLAVALKKITDPDKKDLVVFIQTEYIPKPTETSFLEKLGIKSPVDRKMFTATLSSNEVAKLSDMSWIKYIKLSRELRPL